MIVTIGETNEKTVHGQGFKRDVVKNMVQGYRKQVVNNPDALKYSHFNAFEVLKLMIKNKVIPETLASAVEAEIDHIKQYGVKIYLGSHVNDITLPEMPESRPGAPVYDMKYKNKTTTIVCTTIIEHGIAQNEFRDMLDNKKGCLFCVNDDIDEGDGLDQAEIEPPYHSYGDDCYDIGSSTIGTCG